MTTKLENLKRQEQVAEAELEAARGERARRFTELARMNRPAESAAVGVAALDVHIAALQIRLEDARAEVKLEADRLKSPEALKVAKEIKALCGELAADRTGAAKALLEFATITEGMSSKFYSLRRLCEQTGDDNALASIGDLPRWLNDATYLLRAMREFTAMAESVPSAGPQAALQPAPVQKRAEVRG